MPDRPRVPDAFFHIALWLGGTVALLLVGNGFCERASDRSPWMWWVLAPAALLPLALVVWLRESGRIELIDTEKVENRAIELAFFAAMALFPKNWRFPVWLAAAVVGILLQLALAVLDWHSHAVADRLGAYAGRFAHPEYAAWVLIAMGLLGAAYETVIVVRAAKAHDGRVARRRDESGGGR